MHQPLMNMDGHHPKIYDEPKPKRWAMPTLLMNMFGRHHPLNLKTCRVGITHQSPYKIFNLLIFYGLFLRFLLALSGDFLLACDEVMQYLEQGHRIAFGYGLIPWEYRLGIRPLLIPYFIAFWLNLFSLIGLNQTTTYIPGIKLVFCILSMSIPLGMYQFCKKNYSLLTGYIALFLGCSWYELILTAHKPLSEIFSTELIFLSLYFFNRTQLKFFNIATLLSCLAVAVRPHNVLMVIIILIYYFYKKPKQIIINGLTIMALSVLAIGLLEYSTLGVPWLSYYLYYYYNIIIGVASGFGTSVYYMYLFGLTITSVGLIYVSVIYIFIKNEIIKYSLPLLCLLITLMMHSAIGHKEYRFIYPIIPFWLMLFSNYLGDLFLNKAPYQRTFFIISIISALGLLGLLPKQNIAISTIDEEELSYFKKSNNLAAYLYLSTLKDKGEVNDYTSGWQRSGGYYYLHIKIPLIHTELDINNKKEIESSIVNDIEKCRVRYIMTYINITSKQTRLIKTFGNIYIYESLNSNSNNNIDMEKYDFNRYVPNMKL